MVDAGTFQPEKYLTLVNGADYLEVKWRLVWLRAVFPLSSVETELVKLDTENGAAVFKATVRVIDDDGHVRAVADGHGSEFARNFASYIETAETKALGRALAACGFGTQFSTDFSTDTNGQGLADAPVKRAYGTGEPVSGTPDAIRQTRRRDYDPTAYDADEHMPAPLDGESRDAAPLTAQPDGMSGSAKKFVFLLLHQNPDKVSREKLDAEIRRRFNKDGIDELTRREGAQLTNDWLKPLVNYVDNRDR